MEIREICTRRNRNERVFRIYKIMEDQEVKGRKVAIDIVKANIFAVVIMVVAAIVFLVPFLLDMGR